MREPSPNALEKLGDGGCCFDKVQGHIARRREVGFRAFGRRDSIPSVLI